MTDGRTDRQTDAVTMQCGVVLGGPPNKLRSTVVPRRALRAGQGTAEPVKSIKLSVSRWLLRYVIHCCCCCCCCVAFTPQINRSFLPYRARRTTTDESISLPIISPDYPGRGEPVDRRFGHISDRSHSPGGAASRPPVADRLSTAGN